MSNKYDDEEHVGNLVKIVEQKVGAMFLELEGVAPPDIVRAIVFRHIASDAYLDLIPDDVFIDMARISHKNCSSIIDGDTMKSMFRHFNALRQGFVSLKEAEESTRQQWENAKRIMDHTDESERN